MTETLIDLDEAARKAGWLAHLAAEVSEVSLFGSKSSALANEARDLALTMLPALVAELRVARRVVEEARGLISGDGGALLRESVAVYDQAVSQ